MEKGTWKDVTDECAIKWCNFDEKGAHIIVTHGDATIAYVGDSVCVSYGLPDDYRVTMREEAVAYWCGGRIRVEQFIPDSEPVIAYKAVRVDEDGVFRSILIGTAQQGMVSPRATQREYEIGETTDGGGVGVFCFRDIEDCKRAYVTGKFYPRSFRPIAILKVETTGEEIDPKVTRPNGSVNYPSVKVLSVAWEEKEEEEWVDVTGRCEVFWNSYSTGSYAGVKHGDNILVWLGQRPKVVPNLSYRVTFPDGIGKTHTGYIKVEKRNG